MNKRLNRTPLLLALTVVMGATPALAQLRTPPGSAGGVAGPQRQEAPVALPGLSSRPAVQPIPAEPGQNLAPNAALFDAINRGDIAAAREAVTRGADLDSRNPLGLTPIDAAVDQGRNDIAFFLLSARGTVGSPMRAPAGTSLASPGRGGETAGPTAGRSRVPAALPAPARNAPAGSAPRQVMQPRLWAGDGGAPQPQAGFLGFDAGRPAGAVAPDAPRRGRG